MSEEAPKRVARRIERRDEADQVRQAIRAAPMTRPARQIRAAPAPTTSTPRRALRVESGARAARQVMTRQLTRGDTIRLSPDDGRTHDYLTFKTPSGIIVLAPVEHGSVKVWLLESGTWTYRWGDGEEQVLEVGEPRPVALGVDTLVIDPASLPGLSLARRPRL